MFPSPASSLTGGTFGEEWWDDLFGSMAGLSSMVVVAPSTNFTYEAAWRLWTQWCLVVVHRSVYLDMGLREEAVAREIAKCVAHLYFSRGSKVSTVEGKLVAFQHFRRRVGIELPMKHFSVKSVTTSISRENALKGKRQRHQKAARSRRH